MTRMRSSSKPGRKPRREVALGYIWRDSASGVNDVLLAKRFGLMQRGGKLRVIDDCSIGGINGALGVVEKYKVHAIDETAAFLTWMLQFSQQQQSLEGLSGRTYDMKHAYKQYGIAEGGQTAGAFSSAGPFESYGSLVWSEQPPIWGGRVSWGFSYVSAWQSGMLGW